MNTGFPHTLVDFQKTRLFVYHPRRNVEGHPKPQSFWVTLVSNGSLRFTNQAVAGAATRRLASSRPIQQLTGQVSSHDSQYQCGQPLLQLGTVAARPMTSPRMKNQSTWRAALSGAKRAQIHAQRIETTTKQAVLAMSGVFDGTWPGTKSPGKRRESSGSVAKTSKTERM